MKDVAGAKGLVVRNCLIENVGVGVVTQFADRRTFTSPITSFSAATTAIGCSGGPTGLYGAHPINSYFAVKVVRPGT